MSNYRESQWVLNAVHPIFTRYTACIVQRWPLWIQRSRKERTILWLIKQLGVLLRNGTAKIQTSSKCAEKLLARARVYAWVQRVLSWSNNKFIKTRIHWDFWTMIEFCCVPTQLFLKNSSDQRFTEYYIHPLALPRSNYAPLLSGVLRPVKKPANQIRAQSAQYLSDAKQPWKTSL